MRQAQPAEILQIHISEGDRYEGKTLYEAIVARCREMRIAGATVFTVVEGYGETAEMHRARLGRHDRPVVVTVVDSAENISRLKPVVEAMVDTGALSTAEVLAIRVEKTGE
jgi:PII-like signaling protein